MGDADGSGGPSSPSPVCSVVVPTHGQTTSLGRTLGMLARQTIDRDRYEIIVADNNSDTALRNDVRQIAGHHGCTYVHASERGAGAARNAGIVAATAPVVVFVDDDMVVEPDFLEAHVAGHRGEPHTAVIGPVVPLQRAGGPFHTYLTRHVAMNRMPTPEAVDFRHFYGANSSVDRASLLQVGLFDTTFLRRQDGELAFRLRRAGVTFVVAERALSRHDPSIAMPAYLRRCRRDGYYLAKLAHRHEEFAERENLSIYRGWRPIVAAPASVVLMLVGLLVYPLSPRVLFMGFSAAALSQSARGFRAFERESR